MGKPLKLKPNQFIVTEAQYTVAILLLIQLPSGPIFTLPQYTLRATSLDEAVGMAVKKARQEKEHSKCSIANFNVEKTGD